MVIMIIAINHVTHHMRVKFYGSNSFLSAGNDDEVRSVAGIATATLPPSGWTFTKRSDAIRGQWVQRKEMQGGEGLSASACQNNYMHIIMPRPTNLSQVTTGTSVIFLVDCSPSKHFYSSNAGVINNINYVLVLFRCARSRVLEFCTAYWDTFISYTWCFTAVICENVCCEKGLQWNTTGEQNPEFICWQHL